jgi:2-methylcitrate dehydratase PrpD
VTAGALIDRDVRAAHFEGDSYRDARTAALLPLIHVAPHDESHFARENHFGAIVRVTLRDGTVETARIQQALGRTSDNPVPADRLRRKFELCAATVLRDDVIAPIPDAIAAVDTLADIRVLTTLMMTGALSQARLN